MTRRLQITIDHALCVGNGTCLVIAPSVFVHNSDRQSEVHDPEGDTEATILRAAANCPVAAIRVTLADSGETLSS
jgi:ferredoxin